MSHETLPTIRIKSSDAPGGYIVINESDFVDGMELFEDTSAEPEPDDKADLLRQASELGIKADGRWSVERLKAAIDDALKG